MCNGLRFYLQVPSAFFQTRYPGVNYLGGAHGLRAWSPAHRTVRRLGQVNATTDPPMSVVADLRFGSPLPTTVY